MNEDPKKSLNLNSETNLNCDTLFYVFITYQIAVIKC